MLATYAALDPRVQFLGYTMKVFAKVKLLFTQNACELFPYCLLLCDLRPSVLTALRHRGCVQRKPLVLCLHPDGALLPAAEAAASHSCPAGGIGH